MPVCRRTSKELLIVGKTSHIIIFSSSVKTADFVLNNSHYAGHGVHCCSVHTSRRDHPVPYIRDVFVCVGVLRHSQQPGHVEPVS